MNRCRHQDHLRFIHQRVWLAEQICVFFFYFFFFCYGLCYFFRFVCILFFFSLYLFFSNFAFVFWFTFHSSLSLFSFWLMAHKVTYASLPSQMLSLLLLGLSAFGFNRFLLHDFRLYIRILTFFFSCIKGHCNQLLWHLSRLLNRRIYIHKTRMRVWKKAESRALSVSIRSICRASQFRCLEKTGWCNRGPRSH